MKVKFKAGEIIEVVELNEKRKEHIQHAFINWCSSSDKVKEILAGKEAYWEIIKEEFVYYKIIGKGIITFGKYTLSESKFMLSIMNHDNVKVTKITKELYDKAINLS